MQHMVSFQGVLLQIDLSLAKANIVATVTTKKQRDFMSR